MKRRYRWSYAAGAWLLVGPRMGGLWIIDDFCSFDAHDWEEWLRSP
jgi:hypothetical protein